MKMYVVTFEDKPGKQDEVSTAKFVVDGTYLCIKQAKRRIASIKKYLKAKASIDVIEVN